MAHSLIHGLWQSAPYFINQIGFQIYLLGATFQYNAILLAVAGVSLALLVYLDRRSATRRRLAEGLRRYRIAWTLPLALIVIALAIYGYFVRPQVGQVTAYEYWYGGRLDPKPGS